MSASDTYRTLQDMSESLYKVKGSKHFGYAIPVYSKEEIKERLEEIRKIHHASRHVCYAYRLGLDKKVYRANDDGEPSNSAGKPILGQIQSYDLTNVLIAVVRYFGGVKLGVGGLIDAYRTSAKEAIEAGNIIERQVCHRYAITFPYPAMSGVMKILKDRQLPQYHQQFEITCRLETDVRLDDAAAVEQELTDVDGATFEVLYTA